MRIPFRRRKPAPPPGCPLCGFQVAWDYTCHTYQQGGRWSSCLPCDSAVEYSCLSAECDWGYIHGLNSGNPRSETNEKERPLWLPERIPVEVEKPGYARTTWVHPDVRHRREAQEG